MPTLNCPRCRCALTRTQTPQGVAFVCGSCEGHAAMLDQIRRALPRERFRSVWDAVKRSPAGTLPCPTCASAMRVVQLGALEVDTCVQCELLWLDPGEQERLTHAPPRPPPPPEPTAPTRTASSTILHPSGVFRMTRAEKGLMGVLDGLSSMIVRDEERNRIGAIRVVRSTSRLYNVVVNGRPHFVPGLRSGAAWRNRGELCRTLDACTVVNASMPLWFGSATWVYHRDKQLDWRYISLMRQHQGLFDGDRCIAEMKAASASTVFLNTHVPLEDELIMFLFCLRWGITYPRGTGSFEELLED